MKRLIIYITDSEVLEIITIKNLNVSSSVKLIKAELFKNIFVKKV